MYDMRCTPQNQEPLSIKTSLVTIEIGTLGHSLRPLICYTITLNIPTLALPSILYGAARASSLRMRVRPDAIERTVHVPGLRVCRHDCQSVFKGDLYNRSIL